MTYSRGHYDDEYGRERRPRRDVPERDERRSGSGSSRYSRSSERYARHSSVQRGEERVGRPGSRQNRQRRDDSSRPRYRDELEGRRDVPRSAQRPASRARQYDDGYDERYEPSANARGTRQRDDRAGRQRDQRNSQYTGARAGQRNVAQATQYSRDRYVSQPGQQRGSSVSQQNYERVRRAKPIDPRMIFALGIIALILLAVIIIRFVTFGGVASEYGAAKAAIDQQQTQLTELETSNGELQAEMDSMQGLIDRYNNSGKK